MQKASKIIKTVFLAACITVGLLMVIFAFVTFDGNTGNYESNHTYGADFYTGSQNATAQAANNVYWAGETIRDALGYLLLSLGLLDMLFFGYKLFEHLTAPKAEVSCAKQEQTAPAANVCSNCGASNDESSRFCIGCGAPLN